MNKSTPIVLNLQADAIDEDVPVVQLLRTAKIIATKLGLDDALVWINLELDGYNDVDSDGLPKYRQLEGSPKCLHRNGGWQPLQSDDPKILKMLSAAPLGCELGALEKTLKSNEEGNLVFPYAPENKAFLVSEVKGFTDFHVLIDKGQAHNILDSVRNLILEWTLELEKAGIIGEGMEFSPNDKHAAMPITQQIFAQNVVHIGNANGQAKIKIEQKAVITIDLDMEKLGNFISQAKAVTKLLPSDMQDKVEGLINEIEVETNKEEPDKSKLRTFFESIKNICEGAAGNLTAQGMLGLIKDLFTSGT